MNMRKKLIAAALAVLFLLAVPQYARAASLSPPAEPIRIAFIDSGISTRHIDPAHVAEGRNYVFPESNTQDRLGHGTATAGMVLGAEEQGVVGVCPEAVAVPLVVMDAYPSGVVLNGGTEALCQALLDAVDVFHCQIVNVSLSASEDSPELRNAVEHAETQGVLVISAVGNDGAEGAACFPAAYDTVIAVGSADGAEPAAFSQLGANELAPGVHLPAPTHRSSLRPATVSGTSYSCALVAGFCARLLPRYPGMTPSAVRHALCCLADDLGTPGYDEESGWGLLRTDRTIPPAFSDVELDSWMFPGVFYAAARGLMNGVGDGSFAPDAHLTRAMAVTVLWRSADCPAAEAPLGFADVEADAWYAEAVRWASETGVVTGYDAERFGPEDDLNREQLAAILYRYARRSGQLAADADAGETGAVLEAFADGDQISTWAVDAVRWAVGRSLLTGSGANNISPQAPATRAQVATILMRLDRVIGTAPAVF